MPHFQGSLVCLVSRTLGSAVRWNYIKCCMKKRVAGTRYEDKTYFPFLFIENQTTPSQYLTPILTPIKSFILKFRLAECLKARVDLKSHQFFFLFLISCRSTCSPHTYCSALLEKSKAKAFTMLSVASAKSPWRGEINTLLCKVGVAACL